MTPAELENKLTALLAERLVDYGFRKKRRGRLFRKSGSCEQYFTWHFTRYRGLPGNRYGLTCTLTFTYPEVDRLTSEFLGIPYDADWSTAARPFYLELPEQDLVRFRYEADTPLETFTSMLAETFVTYALPFYDSFDTLEQLAAYFEQHPSHADPTNRFDVVRHGGHACCIAAVLLLLERWDALRDFLETSEQLSNEEKARITAKIPK